MWGVLSLGLFADGTYGDGLNGVAGTVKGLFYGDTSQLIAQSIGVLANIVFVFSLSWVFFKVQDAIMGIRVSAEDEIAGLDEPETGVLAYPDFTVLPAHHIPTGGSRPAAPAPAFRPELLRTPKEVV
jgi:Amt family ammonium transporter